MRYVVVALVLAVAITVSSCSDDDAREAAETDGCAAATTEADPLVGPLEVQAVSSSDVEAWALVFNTWPHEAGDILRMPADLEIKIVWRVTGDGDLEISAIGPDGQTISPHWGPESHGGSSWRRPGDEWGTGWIFPEAGCWSFLLGRGDATATLTADVIT